MFGFGVKEKLSPHLIDKCIEIMRKYPRDCTVGEFIFMHFMYVNMSEEFIEALNSEFEGKDDANTTTGNVS